MNAVSIGQCFMDPSMRSRWRALSKSARVKCRWLAAVLLVSACSCAPRVNRRAMTETIGGVVRPRNFASVTAYEALLRAEVAILRGNYTEAASQLELATFADDTDGWLCARRAEVLLLAGERAAGLESARACARRFPEQAATWIVLGEALGLRGQLIDATAAFTRALAVAPDDPEVRESVARGQGASRAVAARVREDAPQARPSDRTIARRALLDEGRERRPTLASLRRQRAHEAQLRGAFSVVDALLTPLYVSQRASIEERVAIIEARVADGRAAQAAPMVAMLAASTDGRSVSRTELARLWLLVGRPEFALEECVRARNEGLQDARTRRFEAMALGRMGRASEALRLFSTIEPEDGEFVDAQLEGAALLERMARRDLADRVLSIAIERLGREPSRAIERDRLRMARARLGTVTVLRELETAWGRQQRGVLAASAGRASADVLSDLRERSGHRRDDARASAWLVIACARAQPACGDAESARALLEARSGAEEDPVTLVARAVRSRDADEAAALRRRAHERDPLMFAFLPEARSTP